jgi:hypothetical protein
MTPQPKEAQMKTATQTHTPTPLCNSKCSSEGHFYSGEGWAEWLPQDLFDTPCRCGSQAIAHVGWERSCPYGLHREHLVRPVSEKLFGAQAIAKAEGR